MSVGLDWGKTQSTSGNCSSYTWQDALALGMGGYCGVSLSKNYVERKFPLVNSQAWSFGIHAEQTRACYRNSLKSGRR